MYYALFLSLQGLKAYNAVFLYMIRCLKLICLENTDSQTIDAFTTTVTYTKSLYIEIQCNKKYFPQRMI